MGGAFLLVGIVVVCTHLSLASGWGVYAPMSDMAFYPGLPSTRAVLQSGAGQASPDHYASLGGQILIALGITLLAGWVGFTLSCHSLRRWNAFRLVCRLADEERHGDRQERNDSAIEEGVVDSRGGCLRGRGTTLE